MPAVYQKLGVKLLYPENWSITDEDDEDWPRTVTLQSRETGFWSLHVYPPGHDIQQVIDELVAANTRLVAVTAASSLVGSAPDVRVAADLVHDVGGLMVVDASGAAPYAVLDIEDLKADVVAVNAAAWGGPRVGALVFRDPGLLDRLPSIALDQQATGPARLELGGLHYSLLAGATASIDCLASLDEGARGTRRQKLEMSIGSLQDYHDSLFAYLLDRLDRPHLMTIGTAASRVP